MSYSRNNEEEVIARLVEEFPGIIPQCVDIGASFGSTWSNVWALMLKGWHSQFFEADEEKFIKLRDSIYEKHDDLYGKHDAGAYLDLITPDNVCGKLSEMAVGFGVLSIDIDGYDYHVLKALLNTKRPQIICCEINAMIPPPIKFSVKYDPEFWWGNNTFFGMSIAAVHELLSGYGYKLSEVVEDNAIFSLHGEGKPLMTAYREGFLERGDTTDFGHSIASALLQQDRDGAVKILSDMWPEYAGKYEVWR